ncbi:hypothetical protein [Comamonas thiooxydans]|uniref:hypothetical protein n=1 Tax=Comamonas thiooxydans TaxID=363952 RepID=UPI001CCCFFCF|nr:hypothetical protein [Comamonas thiooxydans]UBQ44605.1 hypothetical protein LCH15_25985 [Comamonas thiooxydans]
MQLTKQQAQAVADSLKHCPFCGKRLDASIRGPGVYAINPKARCITEDCWGSKLPVLPLDVPEFVAAYNTRAPGQDLARTDDIQWTPAEMAELHARTGNSQPLQFNTLKAPQ